jgi:hypothetical protein
MYRMGNPYATRRGDADMTDYIRTFSKIKFYPIEPVAQDIRIEDIAHALSLMTRANGHFDYFYSVGQHSINCCKEAKARGYSGAVQLGCLLHDGSEAYISDITRPVKAHLPQYRAFEEILQTMIYERFGLALTCRDHEEIRSVDDALLYHEFIILKEEKVFEEAPGIVLDHDFSLRDFGSVEKEFLDLFNQKTIATTC